jgi:hypothetical protein
MEKNCLLSLRQDRYIRRQANYIILINIERTSLCHWNKEVKAEKLPPIFF